MRNIATITFLLLVLITSSCKKNSNNNQEPENYSEGVLNDNTLIVSADSVQTSLISVDSAKIVFVSNGSGVDKIKVGSILVSDITAKAPVGFLRKVVSITVSGNNKIFNTESTSLSDALKSGKTFFRKKITDADIIREDTSGVDISASQRMQNNLPLTIPYKKIINGVLIEGEFKIEPTFDLIINIDNGTFKTVLALKNTNTIKAEAKIASNISGQIVLKTLQLQPYTVFVGPLPVPIAKQWIAIILGVDGSISAKITASATNINTASMSLEYANQKWATTSSIENSFNKSIDIEGVAKIEPWIQARYEIRPYGLKDSRIYLAARASVIGEVKTNTQNPCRYSTTLDWNVKLSAKAQIKFFKLGILDYDYTFFDKTYPIYQKDTTLLLVKTDTVSSVKRTSAICGASIVAPGACSNISQIGLCWDTFPSPNLFDSKTVNGATPNVFTNNLTGLVGNKKYYVRAYAKLGNDTIFGNEQTFTTKKYQLGDTTFGGIIFYLDATFEHGLVSAFNDQSLSAVPWQPTSINCSTALSTGAFSEAIGSGMSNTNLIISTYGYNQIYAALICKNYNGGGFTDWFLPSFDELAILHIYAFTSGNLLAFGSGKYWSSTQASFSLNPLTHTLNSAGLIGVPLCTNNNNNIRAIRKF